MSNTSGGRLGSRTGDPCAFGDGEGRDFAVQSNGERLDPEYIPTKTGAYTIGKGPAKARYD